MTSSSNIIHHNLLFIVAFPKQSRGPFYTPIFLGQSYLKELEAVDDVMYFGRLSIERKIRSNIELTEKKIELFERCSGVHPLWF